MFRQSYRVPWKSRALMGQRIARWFTLSTRSQSGVPVKKRLYGGTRSYVAPLRDCVLEPDQGARPVAKVISLRVEDINFERRSRSSTGGRDRRVGR